MFKSLNLLKKHIILIFLPSLVFTFVLIRKSSIPFNLEYIHVHFLYFLLGCLVSTGIYCGSWYFIDFKETVGYLNFFYSMILGILSLILLIYFLSNEHSLIINILLILFVCIANFFIIRFMYGKALIKQRGMGVTP